MGHVYGLHLGDGLYRYVGKTIGTTDKRLSAHISDAQRGSSLPVHRWIRKHGPESICLDVLDSSDDDGLLLMLEVCWIAKLRGASFDLLNLTDGGEGTSGYSLSIAQRAAISARRKGSPGTPHTEEYRKMMSKRLKGRGLPWVDKIIESRGDKFVGSGNPRALLSEQEVRFILEIASLDPWPCARAIAERFPVSNGAIERILGGSAWGHIDRRDYPNLMSGRRAVEVEARNIVESAFAAREGLREFVEVVEGG